MQSKFAYVLEVVRANDGFLGLGFKRAAAEANVERTMMRFAMEAFRNPPLASAVDAGTITDPRVVQVFHRLPPIATRIVCKLETRLGRRMSRKRAESLVRAYLKVTGRDISQPVLTAVMSGKEKVADRPRSFPMPRLPAFF